MQTQTPDFATAGQQKFINDLRARVGEATYQQAAADLGCDPDPRFVRYGAASKLIDVLVDRSGPRAVTDGQVRFLSKLRKERGISCDGITAMSFDAASTEIDLLKAMPVASAAAPAPVKAPVVKYQCDRCADTGVLDEKDIGFDEESGPIYRTYYCDCEAGVKADPHARTVAATAEPVNIVGEVFAVTVADGYGKYEVVSDFGGFVTVRHVDAPHTYKCPLLGDEATISRSNVARFIARKGH